mmetsp:Transcript_16192/g.49472  ORF Transcript_16192/g.49472 Transcript_16192/m.49472 type:complete len:446 (-) Transcript_16192:388-1725(-)
MVSYDVRKYPRTGKRGAPQVFPRKLFELLQKEPANVISWDAEGETFAIQDMDAFTAQSLERYFKHHKFTSFQRQLNLYGFRKIAKGERTGYYVHPHFQRDRPEWLSKVRRTPQPGKNTPRNNTAKAASNGSTASTNNANNNSTSAPSVVKPKKAAAAAPAARAPVTAAPSVNKAGPTDEKEGINLALTVTNFISQAVGLPGLLDPGLDSPTSDDSEELDEQGNPLRRSKRRMARRIREHSFQLMEMQQRQYEFEAMAAANAQAQGGETVPAQPVATQPGAEDDGAYGYNRQPAAQPRRHGAATKLRRTHTDDAFMTAIDAAFDFTDFDKNMNTSGEAGLFAAGINGDRPMLHRANTADLTGDIEELWGGAGIHAIKAEGVDMEIDASADLNALANPLDLGNDGIFNDLDGMMDVDVANISSTPRGSFSQDFGLEESYPAVTVMER